MATNWKLVTAPELNKVLSLLVQGQSNENIAEGTLEGSTVDPDADDRRDALVALAVDNFRAAVVRGGRVPLSATADSVPPELVTHVLHMAAYELVNSIPNLQMVIMGEGGVYAPLQKLYAEALTELKRVTVGGVVTYPTDPDPDTLVTHGGTGSIDGEDDSLTMAIN